VNGTFSYLGHIQFPVDSVAEAEEFVFGQSSGGQLQRAVIVHFEHFLPTSGRSFVYPRLRMTQLGADEYLHQTWGFADFSLFREPALEDLLHARGLSFVRRWVADRYVRALAENSHYEIIIFYLESSTVSDPSMTYGGAPVTPPPPPSPSAEVEAAILRRAHAAFSVESP
jgi:hypothetical protein